MENKKNIRSNETGTEVSLKAYMAFALLVLGLIAFNYVDLIEWIISKSIFIQLCILVIFILIGYVFFSIITSTLSLNYYGDTALEITVDEVILGKSLDAKVRLGKYLKVEDKFDIELTNMYTYTVKESGYGESVDSEKTDIIWKKKIVENVIKEEDEFILSFSFDLSIDEGQIETKCIKEDHCFCWELSVFSENVKYGFYRTYKVEVTKA